MLLCSYYALGKHIIVCPQHETAISEYIYEYQLGTLHVCVLMGDIVKPTMPTRPLVQKIRDDRIPQNIVGEQGIYWDFYFIFDEVEMQVVFIYFKFEHYFSFATGTVVQHAVLCYIG